MKTYDVHGKCEIQLHKKYDVPLNKNKSTVNLKCFKIRRIVAFMCKMMQSLFLFNIKSKILSETTNTTKTHDLRVLLRIST